MGEDTTRNCSRSSGFGTFAFVSMHAEFRFKYGCCGEALDKVTEESGK
jgi:hypothetical protein